MKRYRTADDETQQGGLAGRTSLTIAVCRRHPIFKIYALEKQLGRRDFADFFRKVLREHHLASEFERIVLAKLARETRDRSWEITAGRGDGAGIAVTMVAGHEFRHPS